MSDINFYDQLLIQFDSLIRSIKVKLIINSNKTSNNFADINQERCRLSESKKELHDSLQILLSLDEIKDSLSYKKKIDLVQKYKNRLNDFEEVKQLIEQYHEKLTTAINEEDTNNISNKIKNNRNDDYMEYADNDLHEHLLLAESKNYLEQTHKNIEETNILLQQQKTRMVQIKDKIDEGEKYNSISAKQISSVSNKKFCVKIVLHLIVILLGIAIVAGLILKFLFYQKPENN